MDQSNRKRSYPMISTEEEYKEVKIKCEEEQDHQFAIKDEWLKEWSEVEDLKVDLAIKLSDESHLIKKEAGDINSLTQKYSGQSSTNNISAIKRRNNTTKPCSSQDSPVSHRPENLCSYKCPKCGKLLNSWNSFKDHSRRTSKCASRVLMSRVKEHVSKTVHYACKLCSSSVLCDLTFIKSHIYNSHKMRLLEYMQIFYPKNIDYAPNRTYSKHEIGNLCVYQCEQCEKQFPAWSSLRRHAKFASHEISSKRNKKNSPKIVYHQCKVCNKVLICEHSVLQVHMEKTHLLSLKGYCKKYLCLLVEKKEEIESILKSLQVSNSVGNLCEFKCSKCNSYFFSGTSFKAHRLKARHNFSANESLTQSLVRGFSYKCDKCSNVLLCDRQIIFHHMKTSHSVNIRKNYPNLHLKQYNEFCKAFAKDIPVSSFVYGQLILPVTKIPIKEITSIIGNLCKFSCPHCDIWSSHCYASLMRHLKTIHQGPAKYSPSLVKLARYHSCLLCPKAVLNDRYVLKNHLKSRHDRSIKEYENIFKRHGGKTLPSFRTWIKEKDQGPHIQG